jgi:lysozyme
MDRARNRAQIAVFEGRRYDAYPDPITKGDPWTIGVGHTGPEVKEGLRWSDAQVDAALDKDLDHAFEACCRAFPWLVRINDARQAVLVGMAFQMGMPRLAGFVRMLGAVRDERYEDAAHEMLTSLWAKQTQRRASVLARQMQTGEWQSGLVA